MGPLASANLYLKIIKMAQEKYAAVQDIDYPPIMVYSLPLSDFDETGIMNGEKVKSQLTHGVKKLEQMGCDFIIIACNTVHYYFEEMQKAINIPIVSIIEETAKLVANNNLETVGLLSSQSTQDLKIYHKKLNSLGIKTISPTAKEQKIINTIILKVMSGQHTSKDKQSLKNITKNLIEKGAQTIVLGCTEIPLLINQKDLNIKVFDTVEIISSVALKKAMKG